MIDYDYGPHTGALRDGYHHTDKGTIDTISPPSLQIAGDLFLELMHMVDRT